jgi:outer membrane protein insertion porin family
MGLVTQLIPPALHRSARRIVSLLILTTLVSTFVSPRSATAARPHDRKKSKPAPERSQTPEPLPQLTVGVSKHGPMDAFIGKTVGAIEVAGLKRIEKEAVLAKLTSKIGGAVTSESVRADIQAIYGMGFFDDVEIQAARFTDPSEASKMKLIYRVRERPVIAKLEFEGNERISTSDLEDVIKVKQWSILDVNKVKEDVGLIQKHYEDKGFYLAKVTFVVKPTAKPDEVELTYRVNDYDKVQIKKITFLNNRRFRDEELKNTMQETREGGFLSFVTSSGNFKESAFKTDLQRLTYFYLDHGYVKFKYENPVVTISDDKKWLYISIYVDEGDQYKIGNIDFSGDMLFTKDELHADLTLLSDDYFSISKRNADIQKLQEKYQDLGYAFTNVIPKMKFNDDVKTVDIDYSFEKGNLVYFGEINMVGNTKTHDKVIRRELKVHEGELYSGTKMRQSKENVERLGFFQPGEVIFNSITPKGKPDILNIEISVKERSTGTITLGAGYGSVQKFFLTGTIAEINLFGKGQNLSLSAQYSADRIQQSFNLGFTDPYAFDTLWSMGSDVYSLVYIIPNKYTARKLGFDLRFGHPIAEFVYAYITYKNEGLQVGDANTPSLTQDQIQPDIGVLSSVIWSIVRDKRNNRFETTDGNYQSLSLETAGLGGDKDFIKWDINNRFYHHLWGDLVFRNSTETGEILPLADHVIPPSEKFYLGGPNNLKGYNLFLVGPSQTDINGNPIPLGGTFQALSLFELEHPLVKEAGLKIVTFYDIGNSWDGVPNLSYLTIRSDWGFGIRWFSPIGPLRFEWGFPLNRHPGEDSPVFNFFIGPPF